MTTKPTVTDLTVLLLLRVDRLLAEADEVRTLRDSVMALARSEQSHRDQAQNPAEKAWITTPEAGYE